MKRVLVVGTGPSGFAVLNSLESLDGVWVMDGQAEFDSSRISTKSHLGLKMKFGSSHTYVDSKSLGLIDDSSYKLPISFSRGGFGEIWGNGFTPYEFGELILDAGLNLQIKVRNAMKELLGIIPFSHVPGELDIRFGKAISWSESNTFGHLTAHPFFADILKKRKISRHDDLLFGQPSLLLDSKKCTNCGLCLSGCPYGALFDPGEQINKMIFSKKLDQRNFIKGIVQRIEPSRNGAIVYYLVNNEEKSEWFDEIILSTGPLSTALILINSKLLPANFEIPDSQVFYGAFLSKKRIRPMDSSQEVGQLVCYPSSKSINDFQISFYAPSELSRQRISQTIFPSFLKNIRIPRFLSERIVPAIGFLPQESSGKIVIKKSVDGYEISRLKNSASMKSSRTALKRVSASLRCLGLVNLSIATQIPVPGSGFHIGASLPLGGNHVDSHGYLIKAKVIRILDASILPKIPAGAHTFLSMAIIRALIRDES
ncbi:4Fe-4S ferredoxin-type, iron-sulphur binding domain containing protein [Candidatus Nanopelagicaceae bacterium]